MNYLAVAKGVGNVVSSVSAGVVVANLIKATTPTNLNVINRVMVGVGALVLTSLVGDAAGKYADTQIDELSETVSAARAVAEDLAHVVKPGADE